MGTIYTDNPDYRPSYIGCETIEDPDCRPTYIGARPGSYIEDPDCRPHIYREGVHGRPGVLTYLYLGEL